MAVAVIGAAALAVTRTPIAAPMPAATRASTPGVGIAPVTTPAPTTVTTRPSAPTSTAPDAVRLAGAPNFRDLAGNGDGLEVAGGAHLARGVVYRSGRLDQLTTADLRALRGLGLVDVFDLRTPYVAARAPDPKLPGATNHLINLYAVTRSPVFRPVSVGETRAWFRQLNEAFVTDPQQRKRLRSVLQQIATADGPVLIHCTEGKDRTGWVSAMLQYLAGADDQTVLGSYLASNSYRANVIEAEYAARKKAKGRTAADIYLAQSRVDASYLQAGLTAARSRYGSIEDYLRRGVGLSSETIERLRAKLVSR